MGSGLSNVKTGFGKLMREKGNLDQTWNRDQELPGNVKGVGWFQKNHPEKVKQQL